MRQIVGKPIRAFTRYLHRIRPKPYLFLNTGCHYEKENTDLKSFGKDFEELMKVLAKHKALVCKLNINNLRP